MKKKALLGVLLLAAALAGFCAALLWRETVPDGRFAVYGAVQPYLTLPPAQEPAPSAERGRIEINRAAQEELCDLPGIGPALAGRIIEYREANGPFASPEELFLVSGIGEKVLEGILPYIYVDGGA